MKELAKQPIVVILFNREFINLLKSQKPPQEAIGYIYSGKSAGLTVHFFSVDDIRLSARAINGWTQDARGQWVQNAIPWPDFFYDQGKDMTAGERRKADALRKSLIRLVIPINSLRFLDKWFLHCALARYAEVAGLLPDTCLCSQPRHLSAMLRRHLAVIAKPTDSSRGRGICLIRIDENRRCQVISPMGSASLNLTLTQAFRKVQHIVRRDRVLLQQHLTLLRIDKRLLDLRMLMGKNAVGEWIVVSPRLRLGQENSFITNTSRGADRIPLLSGLQMVLDNSTAEALYHKVEHLSITVCQYIERAVGPMGEIGLDFIVDNNLRIWFIEANPQPGKTPMVYEQASETPLLYRHVMDYCAYLWGKQVT